MHPPEPTSDQCDRQEHFVFEDQPHVALWYPQMGGYVGKCVVSLAGPCFEAWVWHDGEFGFGDEQPPAHLHHCDPDQFIAFGQAVKDAQRQYANHSSTE